MDFDSFVLAAATGDLGDESSAREHADALEFRMDFADDPVSALEEYQGELPIIATNRPVWEGGRRTDGEDRIEALREILSLEAVEAVDVELGSLKDVDAAEVSGTAVVRAAAEEDVSVIVSFHDFEATPGLSDLAEIAADVCTLGDVGKISVTAEEPGDVLDLLRVTHEFSSAGQAIATMSMGAPGRHSRIVAPFYGSKIGYAPIHRTEATAPGQFDLETMAALIDVMR
ncbi:MAG: type I 3-dehydroquinate dehydratase [Halodesulfurarchaeum sp.]